MTVTAGRPSLETASFPAVLGPAAAFAKALAAYSAAHWRERDDAYRRLLDAAELAELDLCHVCADGVPLGQVEDATRECWLELICNGCDGEHAATCTVYLRWSAEDDAIAGAW